MPDDKQFFPTNMSGSRTFIWMMVIAAVYFCTAGLSLLFAFEHTAISPLWPPAGIALAAVLLLGYPMCVGIFVGALASNVFTVNMAASPIGPLLVAAFSTAAGNTLEALIGAYLVRRFTGNNYIFKDIKGAFIFVIFGSLLSAAVAAFIGVTGLLAVMGDVSQYWHALFTWWLGDATGVILVSPLFLSWNNRDYVQWKPGKAGEAVLVLFFLCSVSILVYIYDYPLKFLMIPVLLWIILRFSLFETSLSVAILSAIAIWGGTRTIDLSLGDNFNESLLLIQSYIGVVAVTALFLSVIVGERKRSGEAVQSEKAFSDTIINSVPGVFYVLDRKGQLIRWNRFLEELNDLPLEELIGMSSLRNIHEDDREKVLGKINEAFEKGESETEARICTKNQVRHFIFTGRRVDVGGTAYVVGTGIDITERKAAERELDEHQRTLEEKVAARTQELTELNAVLASEVEERRTIEKILSDSEINYRTLVEGANSIILRLTKNGTIIFFNRFAQEFFGYTDEEILGQNIVGTIVPATESTSRDLSTLANDIMKNPEAYVFNENENIKKNGERVWVAWTKRAIVDNN